MPGIEQQDAITESPASFVEVTEGLRTHDTVDGDTSVLLEGAHRIGKAFIEGVVGEVTAGRFT